MKDRRYKGAFLSVDGRRVDVELWQETERPYRCTGQLEFPADEPLRIVWEDASKEDSVEVSHATLRLISPGDRTYTDLYSDEAGAVRMDVYIDGALYWSGTMDAEQYEEPYESARGYEVELTFGDLGVLKRRDYLGYGVKSLREIAEMCMWESGIKTGGVDWSLTGCSTDRGSGIHDGIGVDSECWTDSDGEQRKLWDVLECSLQPLGLKIRQKSGRLWVYDIQGLTSQGDRAEVYWSGASQTLGGDRVYRRAKVTWSTYCRDGNMLEEEPWGDESPEYTLRRYDTGGTLDAGTEVWSVLADVENPNHNDRSRGFALLTKDAGRGLDETHRQAKVMAVVPGCDGEAAQGVAVVWTDVDKRATSPGASTSTFVYEPHGVESLGEGLQGASVLLRTTPSRLPLAQDGTGLMLRLEMGLALTGRPNPWEEWPEALGQGDFSPKEAWNSANIVSIPIRVMYQADSGRLYEWQNRDTVYGEALSRAQQFYATPETGEWAECSEGSEGNAWLMWYEPGIFDGTTGEVDSEACGGGIKTNRQAIRNGVRRLSKAMTKDSTGQLLAWPPEGPGDIWVEVLDRGWSVRRRDMRISDSSAMGILLNQASPSNRVGVKWALIGMPTLEAVDSYSRGLDTSDVEYTLDLNAAAEEDIEIETDCGTKDGGVAMARGAYIDMPAWRQVERLRRGPNTAEAEMLLCAMLKSQYGVRRIRLSGEAAADTGGLKAYTETNQGGRLFMMSGEDQDLRMMTSEITITEAAPDAALNTD